MATEGWEDRKDQGKGAGKSPTKFMERPGQKPGKDKEKQEPQEGDTGIGEGNAEFLDQQEKVDSEQDSTLNEIDQNSTKKQDRKDAPKQDSSSEEDKGDHA